MARATDGLIDDLDLKPARGVLERNPVIVRGRSGGRAAHRRRDRQYFVGIWTLARRGVAVDLDL
jgi:hypothetical protein